MLNYIWAFMIIIGIVYGAFTGHMADISNAAIESAKDAVSLCITMLGVVSLWVGLMEIAKSCGLIEKLTKALMPFIHFLFPNIPKGHKSLEYISLNTIANILGLGWAATPAGLKAMEELAKLEEERGNPEYMSEDKAAYGAMGHIAGTAHGSPGYFTGTAHGNPGYLTGTRADQGKLGYPAGADYKKSGNLTGAKVDHKNFGYSMGKNAAKGNFQNDTGKNASRKDSEYEAAEKSGLRKGQVAAVSKKPGNRSASDEMCIFLILNISSLQLIPVNIIAYRSQYGSVNPASIIMPAILATTINTIVAIIFCKLVTAKSAKR